MRWYLRLGRSGEIAYVRRRGAAVNRSSLVVYAVPARDGRTRVAVSVSKTVGKAVIRNLVRRRIRGALDGYPELPQSLRILIVVKPAAAGTPYAQLAGDVAAALGKLGNVPRHDSSIIRK